MSEIKKASESPKVDEKKEIVPPSTLSAQLEAKRPLASEEPDTDKYLIGCTPDAKKFYMTIGGHSFPVFTCRVGLDLSKQDVEIPERGQIVDLSESQLKRLKEAILRKGIRFVGEMATTFFSEGKGYQINEFPVAMFIYIHKIDDLVKLDASGWRTTLEIPTLMKRDEELTTKLGSGWKDTKGNERPLIIPFVEDKMNKAEFLEKKMVK